LSERARSCLTTIQIAIEDVAETVSRMREFYRPRETEMVLSRVACNRVLEQVINLTRARWSDLPQQRGVVIQLRTELTEELPQIMGAEVELRDALTNLISMPWMPCPRAALSPCAPASSPAQPRR